MFTTVPIVTPATRKAGPARLRCWFVALVVCAPGAFLAWAQDAQIRTTFRVKYAIDGAAYLDGGSNANLVAGMKLVVKRPVVAQPGAPAGSEVAVAELEINSVADSSAVCDIVSSTDQLHAGDKAYLSKEDANALIAKNTVSATRKYPQVITFTEGDPLEEEAREAVPRPPLPEVNRARGRIGVEYGSVRASGGESVTNQLGLIVRADITRIGGSYWNLGGYWRGRFDLRSGTSQPTMEDLMNRTYHLGLTYANPNSRWTAGFGRLILPWASSLDTIDGGYIGARVASHTTLGVFAGTTPDPAAWNYNPDRRIAGTFVNFEGGSFEALRFTSTTGVAVSSIGWNAERRFVFTENGIFWKNYFSLYHSLQADKPPAGLSQSGTSEPLISRSYLTLRIQPYRRLSFDINHNYYRDLPTFDSRLISTGLLDTLLFQGLSAGVRVELPRRVSVYSTLGRTSRTGDQRNSINQMYGVTLGRIWRTGLRADIRQSTFDSSFGSGKYRSVSLSRNFGDAFHWELQGGTQTFLSPLTSNSRSKFVTTNMDVNLGRHYFVQGAFTVEQGEVMNYQQWFTTLGYRFDTREKKR
jgi:hypothetical protein